MTNNMFEFKAIPTFGITDYPMATNFYIDFLEDTVFTNWGTMQLEIQDPFGNLLRFNENINS